MILSYSLTEQKVGLVWPLVKDERGYHVYSVNCVATITSIGHGVGHYKFTMVMMVPVTIFNIQLFNICSS